MRRRKVTFEWFTNIFPLISGLVLLALNPTAFWPIFWYALVAALIGLGATLVIAGANALCIRSKVDKEVSEELAPTFGRLSWMALAIILLIAAVNKFNLAIYSAGIPALESSKSTRCFNVFDLSMSTVDMAALVFGGVLVLITILVPVTTVAVDTKAHRQRLHSRITII
jgi:hypothetical protein